MTPRWIWAALTLVLIAPTASAQDRDARWRAQSDAELLDWVARETRRPGEERLRLTVSRDEHGEAAVVERGITLDGENATAAFERHHRAMAFELRAVEAPPSAELVECQTRFARCPHAPRQCTGMVRRCLFGEQVLARGGEATLVLEHPATPQEHRWGEREAVLRWQGRRRRVRIPLSNGVDDPAGFAPTMAVERLSARRQVLVLTVQQPGDEDPPRSRLYFLIRDGSLVELRDPTIANFEYDSRLPGNGTIVVDETPYTTCEQQGYPRRARRSRVVVRVSDEGHVLSARRVRRPGSWDCRELPACPYVDRLDGDRPERLGEILQNVRYTPETQALDIGRTRAVVRLSISEEKPEVTHLDAVWLRVGDVVIPPEVCTREAPVHCLRDGRSVRLEQGDTLELEFRIPAALRGHDAALVAHGMYVPE